MLACHTCLLVEYKESLVFYVAYKNPGARAVYHRVGLQGLEDGSPAVAWVEPGLEIGFNSVTVEFGIPADVMSCRNWCSCCMSAYQYATHPIIPELDQVLNLKYAALSKAQPH
jgi:hypothetical protein